MSSKLPLPVDGDRPLSSAQRALVVAGRHLVDRCAFRIAGRYRGRVQPHDLLGVGTIALMRAARDFDPARGVDFYTYAVQVVRGRMLNAVDRELLTRDERIQHGMDLGVAQFSEQETCDIDLFLDAESLLEDAMDRACDDRLVAGVTGGLLAAPEPTGEEAAEQAEVYAALDSSLQELEADERLIVLLHHQACVSLDGISERRGLHRNTVGTHYRRAMRKLRDAMASRGFTHSLPRTRRLEGSDSPRASPGEEDVPRSSAEWEAYLVTPRPAGTWLEGDPPAGDDAPQSGRCRR